MPSGLQLTKFPPNHQELRLQYDKARSYSILADDLTKVALIRAQGIAANIAKECSHVSEVESWAHTSNF